MKRVSDSFESWFMTFKGSSGFSLTFQKTFRTTMILLSPTPSKSVVFSYLFGFLRHSLTM
jgi:hypothetical protein